MSGYSHLTADERDRLAGLRAEGLSVRAIARSLGRSPSTISREIRRNALESGGKNRCAAGKREYVQAPRLLETFPMAVVHGAVTDALKLGAISYDAVKHLALRRVERRPPKLSLDACPYLPEATVETTSAASYMSLLAGAGAPA